MPKKLIYLIVNHYSEIALKGKNRKYFENLFINNIRKHIKGFQRNVRAIQVVKYKAQKRCFGR